MSNVDFINGLAATVTPVRARRLPLEVLALVGAGLVQLVSAFYYFDDAKLAMALQADPSRMLLKFVLFGAGAVAFGALALHSLNPAARRMPPLISAGLAVVWIVGLVGFERDIGRNLGTTFYPEFGILCMLTVASLALPLTLLFGMLMMRGATTQPGPTAWLIGLAGGCWGAFVYSLQCPFVTATYLGLWYAGGIAFVAIAARLILPRMARW